MWLFIKMHWCVVVDVSMLPCNNNKTELKQINHNKMLLFSLFLKWVHLDVCDIREKKERCAGISRNYTFRTIELQVHTAHTHNNKIISKSHRTCGNDISSEWDSLRNLYTKWIDRTRSFVTIRMDNKNNLRMTTPLSEWIDKQNIKFSIDSIWMADSRTHTYIYIYTQHNSYRWFSVSDLS